MRTPTLLLITAFVLAPPASAQSAAEWAAKGRALADSGKHSDAVKAWEKAVKLEDKSSAYHMGLAEALGQVARKSNVIKQGFMAPRIKREMERARDLDPNSIGPHEGLMEFYMEAPGIMGGSMDKARKEAAEIAKLHRLRGHFAMADIAVHEKDSTAILREYMAAVNDDPDSLRAYTTLALFYANSKKPTEAFATMERLLARHPTMPMATFYIGRFAGLTGLHLDRGEAALRKYLALPPDTADRTRAVPAIAHLRLGDIYVKKGNKAEARKEYETALALNPKLEAARVALKQIQ